MKKNILLLAIALVLTSCATKTSFQSFYKENSKESALSIGSSAFFANLFIPKDDLSEYEEVFKKVRHYRMMVFSDNVNSINKKFKRFIRRKKYTSIYRVSNNGDKVQFYFLENKKFIKEIVLKVKSDDSYVLFGLKTNIKERDLIKLIETKDTEVISVLN